MYIRQKHDSNRSTLRVQIVESLRQGKKVRQRILRHVGSVDANSPEQIKKLLAFAEQIKADLEFARNPQLPLFTEEQMGALDDQIKQSKAKADEPIEFQDQVIDCQEEVRYVSGIREVFAPLLAEFGWDQLLGQRRPKSNRIVAELVKARISQPESKRATVKTLEQQAGVQLSLDRVYQTLDQLDESCIERIKTGSALRAQQLLASPLKVLFYDTTTLYFESEQEDQLRLKGYSKDGKAHRTQVLLAMVVTEQGIPLDYQVYPGNQYEGSTLLDAVNALRHRFVGSHFTVVADAGLLNQANCQALKQAGIAYILGYRVKSAPKAMKALLLDKESYTPLHLEESKRESDVLSYQVIDYEDQRIIATHSAKRQRKERHLREKQLSKLRDQLKRSHQPSAFSKKAAWLDFSQAGQVSLSESKIQQAEQWDGIRALVCWGCEHLENTQVLQAYRQLWHIEHAFRVNKHDLKIRPIYHWKPERIQAHIALCYMAFCCLQHLRYRLHIKGTPMSAKAIQDALNTVQYSVLRHQSQRRYVSPSPITTEAKRIYQCVGLKWYERIFLLREPSNQPSKHKGKSSPKPAKKQP